jgi:hypothetical protein
VWEALPAGYPAYTCVRRAHIDDAEVASGYRSSGRPTWDVVRDVPHRRRTSADGWQLGSESTLNETTGAVLAQILGVRGATADFIMIDVPQSMALDINVYELSGDDLAARLADQSRGPVLWFPKSREWICATPWEARETYLASDDDIASAVRHHVDLDTLACHWPHNDFDEHPP